MIQHVLEKRPAVSPALYKRAQLYQTDTFVAWRTPLQPSHTDIQYELVVAKALSRRIGLYTTAAQSV